jgi:hypothetical protein
MAAQKPSDYHPDLLDDRLYVIAELLYSARNEVFERHEPDAGDDAWSLGCRAFSWCRNRLVDKARSGEWPWLELVSDSKRLIFRVGAVPVRFYRGIPANPPLRTLAHWHDELRQLSLAFGENSPLTGLKWRFVLETGFLGEPISVLFAGFTGPGRVHCSWPIPITAKIIPMRPKPTQPLPSGVELDSPAIEVPSDSDSDADQTGV